MKNNNKNSLARSIWMLFAFTFIFWVNAKGDLPEGLPVTDALSVFLDAESVEANGDHVIGMLDRTGNENHAWEVVDPDPSLPILLENATPSGLDAVRFDGVGGYAEVPGNPADFDGRARTVFVVARADALTSSAASGAGRLMNTAYSIIDSWEPANTQPFIRHRTTDIWLQTGGVFGVNVRNPLGDWVDVGLDGNFSAGEFFIGVQEWKGNGDLFAHVRNGSNETFSGDAIGGMAEPEGHMHTRIGAGSETRNTRVMDFFGGEVSAVLIYNRELSSNEREDVELYLYGTYLDSGAGNEEAGNPPVLDGLVLHLNAMNVMANDGYITELVDVSGSGNNAIAHVHDPKPGLPTLVQGATETGQDAVRFDGIGGYADVAASADFDGRAKTTIAVFRPTHLAGSDYVTTSAYESLDSSLPLDEQSAFVTRVNQIRAFGADGGNLRVSGRTKSGGAVNISTPDGSMDSGEFYIGINHWRENGDLASILRDGNNQRFEAVATGADGEPAGHIATRLGGNFASGDPTTPGDGEFFEGEIAAFLIYNRELSDSELQTVESHLHDTYFGAGPGSGGPANPPVTDGLVLHLNGANVLTDEGDVVTELVDGSGRGNDATTFFYEPPREGGPTLITSGTPSGKPAVRFDGNHQYLEIGSSPQHFDGFGKTTLVVFNAAVLDGRLTNIAYEEVAPGLAPSGRTRFGELHPWSSNGGRLRANNRTDTGGFIGAHTPDGSLAAGEYFLGINLARDNGDTVSILRNTANERFEGTAQADPPDPQGHIHTRIAAGSGFGDTGLDMFYAGDIAAVLIFNRELSAAELDLVEEYLYDHYLNAEAPAGTFSSWISGFDVPSALASPEADASGDGVANLVKYALGQDPTIPTRAGLPTSSTEVEGEHSYLTISIEKNPDAEDVSYIVEGSEDLKEWSSDGVELDGSDPSILRARLAEPLEDTAKGFLRFRVMLNE